MPPIKRNGEESVAEQEGRSGATPPTLSDPSPVAPPPAPSGPTAPDDAPDTVANSIEAVGRVPAGDDEKEPVSRLIEESADFFGHPSHVAAGAFSPLAECGITELTRSQGSAVIEAWLGSAVHQEDRD